MSGGTRLLVAGGGTGGHLFPGVAVAEELRRLDPESEVLFVGTKRGIESRVLPDLGWQLELIDVSGIKTVGFAGAIRGALRVPGALMQSRQIIRAFKPDLVLGVGGYASGPVVLAAKLMRVRTAILEQNSIPGMTNRILGKVAKRVFLSFAHTQRFFKSRKSELVGNPIRRQILEALGGESEASSGADKRDSLRLFVFGGSQGAVAVNAMCCAAAEKLREQNIVFDIVHQTGKADLEATRERYEKGGVAADCRAFIEDMASEYKAADLIVSRAGATTIAELGIVGLPAILIPYPFAANNHQELNAQEMVDSGAAVLLRQEGNESGEALAELLSELCHDRAKREKMADAMRALGRADAATKVVQWAIS